jgi:arsenate reductase (thioredoxin)
MAGELSEQSQLSLKKCREKLHDDFDGMLPAARVDSIFDDSVALVQRQGRFDDYVPALAEKLTRDRLRAAAQSEGLLRKSVPEVLFVALHDTGRGQMGAAIMHRLAGERINVQSAGTRGTVVPVDAGVAEAMREIGLDLDGHYSKPLTPDVLHAADVVITMGRSTGDVAIPEGVRHVDWRIGDPGEAPLDEVRRIRDEIAERVQDLVAEIAPG